MKTTSYYKLAATALVFISGLSFYNQLTSESERPVAIKKIDLSGTAALKSILERQAPAAGTAVDAIQAASEITSEALKAFSGEPSLPLITFDYSAENMNDISPDLLLERLAQGEHILVSWQLNPYYEDALSESYYQNSILRAAELGLPLVFNIDALESALLHDAYFATTPDNENPATLSENGSILEKLSPFAPDDVWYEAGTRWAESTVLRNIQAWYPNPPLIVFISTDQVQKLSWKEAKLDARFTTQFDTEVDENTLRTMIDALWIEKFRQLHLGFTTALQEATWAANTKFISSDQLASDMGISDTWMDTATITNRTTNVWPITANGLNLDFVIGTNTGAADSPYIKASNQAYMIKEAQTANPSFVSMLTLNDNNQIDTMEHYAGFAKFAMWFLRPDIITRKDNSYDPVMGSYFFDTLTDAVESIYANATLQEYWLNGALVPNGTSPFNIDVPDRLLETPRWYLLNSGVNFSDDWTSNEDVALWAFALELQKKTRTESSEALLFTNSTYGDKDSVDVTVPGYGDVMVDAAEEGTFTTLTSTTATAISSESTVASSSSMTASASSESLSAYSSSVASEPASASSETVVESASSSVSSPASSSAASISSAAVVESTSSSVSSPASSSSASISSVAVVESTSSSVSSPASSSSTSVSSMAVDESASSSVSSPASSSPVSSSSSASAVSLPECQTGPATQEGTVFDSATGEPIANVTVSIAGCSTTTDAQGYYSLTNIATNDKAAVNFTLEGYLPNTAVVQVEQYYEGTTQLSSNYLEFSIGKYASWNPWSFESETGASGGAVEVPASACIYPDGTSYQGTVQAYWIFVDTTTTTGRDLFPGEYEGKNLDGETVPFVSYGFMSLEMKDGSGTALDVSENITLVLTSVSGTTATSIPLWYFDYASGTWNEQGSATRQDDGSYLATVAHPGTWSLSLPIEKAPGIYRGHIVYKDDGAPAKDIRVHAVGANWISSDLSTDAEGNFEIEVIPDSSFQLKAYNYKDKYGAVYDGIISAIASGEVIEETE